MVDENIDLRAVLNDHLVAGVLDDGGNAAHVAESLITDTVVSRLRPGQTTHCQRPERSVLTH